jgi:DNA polymerase-3 subunit epsilon
MTVLRRWLRPRLDPGLADRVEAWLRLPAENLRLTFEGGSYIAVDVETSGLDVRRDRLISVGAVEIVRERLVLGRGFHGVLRQEQASTRENVLLHGIGHEEQAAGTPPQELLMEFMEYTGKRPLIAFHASFDRGFLQRAIRRHLGVPLANPFLDLAMLLPALFPPPSRRASLDDWLARFGLESVGRHSADADALAAGELFLIALPQARRKGLRSFLALAHAAEDYARRTAL